MKIAVVGCRGQLGRELCRQFGSQAVGLGHAELDITDPAAVARVLRQHAPDVVINTAGYTAVDRAEQEPEACFAVNSTAATHLAEACNGLNCTLVQISSDYVFGAAAERPRPYREADAVCPLGVYAHSKLAGEKAAAGATRHFIVRTCGLYGVLSTAAQSNFVDTMLRLGRERPKLRVVNDQWCTPSYVGHIAQAVRYLIGTTDFGLYHVVNRGQTTWHAFACEIFRQAGMTVEVQSIATAEYGAAAPRPSYSVLDTAKYESLGGPPLPEWQEALAEYLALKAVQ